MSNGALLVNVSLTLIQLGIFSIFYAQSRKFDRNSGPLLTAIAFGVIASSISILEDLIPHHEVQGINLNHVLLSLQLVLYSFEYFFVFFHFELASRKSIDWKPTSVFFFLQGVLLVSSLTYVLTDLNTWQEFIWDSSYNLLGILAFSIASYYLYFSYRFTGERVALIQAGGTMLLVLGFVIGFITTPVIRSLLHYHGDILISDIIKVFGALLFISIYAINPDFVERITVETYGVLVFDKGGRELAFINVQSKKKNGVSILSINPTLFSSLITALITFLKEVLISKEYLTTIESADKNVMIEIGERIGVALITDHETVLLRRSLKKFMLACETALPDSTYLEPLDKNWVSTLLLQKFPYLVQAN